MAAPQKGLEALHVLIGTWDTSGTILETGRGFTATDRYEWFPGSHFILHHVDADMDGQPVRVLEIFAADAGGCSARSYDNGGGIADSRVSIDGLDFIIDGTAERFRGRFAADLGAIEGRWESRRGQDWQPWMTVRLEKRA